MSSGCLATRERPGGVRFASAFRLSLRLGEARDLLTPVYARFTEGLDASDLVDVKELLDQLR